VSKGETSATQTTEAWLCPYRSWRSGTGKREVGGEERWEVTTTMGALRLDAKEPGIECITPLDVLASIHFQWAMHDEGHRAERQARRPTHVSAPHEMCVREPDLPVLVSRLY